MRCDSATASDATVDANFTARAFRLAEREARARDKTFTPKAAHALGALSLEFLKSSAADVRAYAAHASRDVITREDVGLRARRASEITRVVAERRADADADA